MSDTMQALIASFDEPTGDIEPEVVDPELIERLKSLGYIGE
jgi:hypothetical protein